jgi:hypothetical protein
VPAAPHQLADAAMQNSGGHDKGSVDPVIQFARVSQGQIGVAIWVLYSDLGHARHRCDPSHTQLEGHFLSNAEPIVREGREVS